MSIVLERTSEAKAFDLLREQVSLVDPATGDELSFVDGYDELDLEVARWKEAHPEAA